MGVGDVREVAWEGVVVGLGNETGIDVGIWVGIDAVDSLCGKMSDGYEEETRVH
jgi:hypothetical protein